ncbi:hypothetical protein CBL_08229 [Carabus blaptoides fortunei]
MSRCSDSAGQSLSRRVDGLTQCKFVSRKAVLINKHKIISAVVYDSRLWLFTVKQLNSSPRGLHYRNLTKFLLRRGAHKVRILFDYFTGANFFTLQAVYVLSGFRVSCELTFIVFKDRLYILHVTRLDSLQIYGYVAVWEKFNAYENIYIDTS